MGLRLRFRSRKDSDYGYCENTKLRMIFVSIDRKGMPCVRALLATY